MYGETVYGRHSAQHKRQWKLKKKKEKKIMSSLKSNENIYKKEDGHTTKFRVIKPHQWPVMTRQRKPEETYCNFAIFN